MKIQNINQNLTFGYNKALNNRLETVLDKDTAPISKELKSLNTFCNNLEDSVILMDKTNQATSKTNQLLSILYPLKLTLSQKIEELYPNLKYAQKESDTYLKKGEIKAQKGLSAWESNLGGQIALLLGITSDGVQAEDDDDDGGAVLLQHFIPDENSPKGLEEVVGLEDVKVALKKMMLPLIDPQVAEKDFQDYGEIYPQSILLSGPEGCGKNYIIEAFSSEYDIPLLKMDMQLSATSPDYYKKAFDFGENFSKQVNSPILFEMENIEDGIGNFTDKEINEIAELFNSNPNIFVIATCKNDNNVNKILLNKLSEQIEVKLPTQEERKEFLKIQLQNKTKAQNLLADEEKMNLITEMLKNTTRKNINEILLKASKHAQVNGRKDIDVDDFEFAINIKSLSRNEIGFKFK